MSKVCLDEIKNSAKTISRERLPPHQIASQLNINRILLTYVIGGVIFLTSPVNYSTKGNFQLSAAILLNYWKLRSSPDKFITTKSKTTCVLGNISKETRSMVKHLYLFRRDELQMGIFIKEDLVDFTCPNVLTGMY